MLAVMFVLAVAVSLGAVWCWWREAKREVARAAAFAAVPRVRAGPCVDVLRMQPSHKPVIRRIGR